MSAYAPLLRELDHWEAAGRTAEFWLRDDDAVTTTAALEQLLACLGKAEVPAVMAVIPVTATAALASRLREFSQVTVWQHGIAHANNAMPPAKAQELVAADDQTVHVIGAAFRQLEGVFGNLTRPVLVPPWNRIDSALVPRLWEAGIKGLSTYKPRPQRIVDGDVWQVNAHIDIIDWKKNKKLVDTGILYQRITDHLKARRSGEADPTEPTGILTHHLVMGESGWAFLSDLFALTKVHASARWCVPNIR